jgi:hypothetical protein
MGQIPFIIPLEKLENGKLLSGNREGSIFDIIKSMKKIEEVSCDAQLVSQAASNQCRDAVKKKFYTSFLAAAYSKNTWPFSNFDPCLVRFLKCSVYPNTKNIGESEFYRFMCVACNSKSM